MSEAMSLNIPSHQHDDASRALATCRGAVLAVVQAEAAQELSVKHGMRRAADIFELPYERVRSYWHDAIRRPAADEYLRIRRAYRAWCWDKQMQLAAQIGQLRQELQELGDDGE